MDWSWNVEQPKEILSNIFLEHENSIVFHLKGTLELLVIWLWYKIETCSKLLGESIKNGLVNNWSTFADKKWYFFSSNSTHAKVIYLYIICSFQYTCNNLKYIHQEHIKLLCLKKLFFRWDRWVLWMSSSNEFYNKFLTSLLVQ